jgi:hypothetical protein
MIARSQSSCCLVSHKPRDRWNALKLYTNPLGMQTDATH